ncbi:MAG TPA: class I SAM-dependent methyltransferase [Thermoanaerobaculia bacterium]|nr:class I SAM-dependent methyltransferase [Thermoanaerobaculia bacterium]
MPKREPTPRSAFDAAYYHRFYGDPRTRVADPESCAALAGFVFSYLQYMGVPVERVLDIGCGVGLWRQEVLRRYPAARYVGVEKSDHACREHGWEKGCVTDYRAEERFDLVICQGVLPYLDDAGAEAAIRNLPNLVRSALYLEVLTREDWERNCDQRVTDGRVHLRSAAWYRERLRRDFLACGGGLFLRKGTPVALFELEYLA